MVYLHKAFQAARKAIMSNFDGVQSKYQPILDILDKRWEKHYKSPIVKAAFFLNPHFYYKLASDPQDANQCDEFEDVFNNVLDKLIINDIDLKIKILCDMCLYKNRYGKFGSEQALKMADTQEPLEWWGLFGNKTTELKKVARRIVGLCCSPSTCERNWSTFTHFHTKSRNMLGVVRHFDSIISCTSTIT